MAANGSGDLSKHEKTSLNPHDNDILKSIFNPSLPYDDPQEEDTIIPEEKGNVTGTRPNFLLFSCAKGLVDILLCSSK